MEPLLLDAIEITQAAGKAIMGYYRDAFSVSEKSPDNPVTDADLAADRLLRQRLGQLLPEAGWLSEETVDNPERTSKRYSWVVDPLDGTKEFVMGIPEFAVSVGLVDEGLPVLAVVLNPATGELFTAAKGQGTRLNGRPVAASDSDSLSGARIDASRSERKRGEFAPFEGVVQLRTMGSIAYKLARVAAGQTDATWSRGPKNEWDICAGALLVWESGGQCTDLSDRPLRFNQLFPKVNGIIADNGRLHQQVVSALAPYGAARTEERP